MSSPSENLAPIIIKKKVVHGGHHGGAWKVAYADFVTAMMALFIVLWLLSSSEQVKKAVAGYFKDPSGKGAATGTGQAGSGDGIELKKDDLGKLKEKLEEAVKKMPELAKLKDQVNMTVTGEGLRVELLESERGTFFESGKPAPSGPGEEMLKLLALELGKMPNRLLIEGHTDAKPFASSNGYSNWELSADRANSARHLMQANGVRLDQIAQVRGFADQKLRKADDPTNASNRRVSIIVQYQDHAGGDEKAEGKGEHGKAEGGHGEAKPEHGGEAKAGGHGESKPAEHGEPKKEASHH